MWKYIMCPHILQFIGAFYHNNVPAIVTPWVRHGNITEYLEKHPDVDRLRLVSLSMPLASGVTHFTSCHNLASRCGQRNRVPPQTQHSAWGCKSGKPFDSRGGFDRGLVVFTDEHPHSGRHSAPIHTRRLRFCLHNDRTHGNPKRRTRFAVIHGSGTPPPEQIWPREKSTVKTSRYLRSGHDNLPGPDG